MPHRLLNSRIQNRILRASIGLPVLTGSISLLITLYLGHVFQKNELSYRHAALNTVARAYAKQFEMTILNSTLRAQSMLDSYGPSAERIVNQRKAVDEILRHTVFQRMTLVRRLKEKSKDGLPVLERTYYSQIRGDTLPIPNGPLIISQELVRKIDVMNKTGRQSALLFSHSEKGDYFHLVWHSSSIPHEYVVFSTPLKVAFSKFPADLNLAAIVRDDDLNLKVLIEWSGPNQIRVIGNQDRVNEKLAQYEGERIAVGDDSDFSSLKMSWIGRTNQAIGPLTWAVWISGLVITLLLSLLIRFIVDQNRKVADLVVRRTVDLESALNDATEANLAKTRFLANVSHELRTPLNIILGMIDMVEEKVNDPKTLEFLKTIRLSGDQLLSLITDLLDVAKRDHSQIEVNVKSSPIRIPLFFEEVIRLISEDCRKKGLELQFEIAPDIPACVRGDPARVRQVLLNLLRNAIKYTSEGFVALRVSKVQYSTESSRQFVTIRMSLQDSGVGIPKTKRHQIFERFLQLESTKVLSQGGVGLGLSIVRDLVAAMDGNISVESDIGLGSTFAVDLNFEVVDSVPWPKSFTTSQKLNISLVSDRAQHFTSLRHTLVNAPVEYCEISKADFESLKLNESSYYLIDFEPGLKLHGIPPNIRKRIVILASGADKIQGAEFNGYKVVDVHPLLPTQFWNALGVRVLDPKARSPVETDRKPLREYLANRKLSILVADDDKGNRHLFEAYFEGLGWRLDFTENGKEALECYRKQQLYDVIIADLRMPIMDGFELTDHVRAFEASKNFKNVPIILVTADALDETARQAQSHGVNAFLTKPIRKSKILDAIMDVTSVSSHSRPVS